MEGPQDLSSLDRMAIRLTKVGAVPNATSLTRLTPDGVRKDFPKSNTTNRISRKNILIALKLDLLTYCRPYQLPLVNVAIRVDGMGSDEEHEIPAKYLQKYPRIFDLLGPRMHEGFIHLRLSGISRRIVHTIVHFMYTGEYETIETDDQVQYFDEPQNVREEFKKSVEVYHAAKKYEVYGLQALAEKYMEHFGESMTSKEVISSTKSAFLDLPRGEIWLPNYVRKVIERELVPGKSDANIRAIVGKRNLEGPTNFNAAILWMVIDILSARVHSLQAEAHIEDKVAPEVEDDREPKHVAKIETATVTNRSVRLAEEYTSSEDGFVVNGFTAATPQESGANESTASPAIPAEVLADEPDEIVPESPFRHVFDYSSFVWPASQPPMNRQTGNSNTFACAPEPAGPIPADLNKEDVPPAEEPVPDEPFPECDPEEPTAEAEELYPAEPPAEEPPTEEAPAEEPPVEEPATEPTLADMLLGKSYLYRDWKNIVPGKRRKRSKKLRSLGLPVPDENGIVSIAL